MVSSLAGSQHASYDNDDNLNENFNYKNIDIICYDNDNYNYTITIMTVTIMRHLRQKALIYSPAGSQRAPTSTCGYNQSLLMLD